MSGLYGKLFITGGTGTLGTTLIRMATEEAWPCTITVYSRDELKQAQLRARYPQVTTLLGDVRDYARLEAAMAGHDTVLHLAALKRIPECEAQPGECMQTNVLGTANVVRACIATRIRRAVLTSTDKACASITCYGASKRMAESLFVNTPRAPTTFTVVRYGNVVASRGSVIPIWRRQAAAGEALTITDRSMTRFWMAPSEAARLVVRALTLQHGQILVAKMHSLGIADMAGIICPGADMTETGLRSLEKRHEDLVHHDEVAYDNGDSYILNHPCGAMGTRYTSDGAVRLTPDEFRRMLAEVEAHE